MIFYNNLSMSDLSKHINIGKDLESKLIQVGINSFDELKLAGTENAFLRIQAINKGACFNLLCAIDGAIQNVRWHYLPTERKEELKQFLSLTNLCNH